MPKQPEIQDQVYALYPKSGGGRGFTSHESIQQDRLWREEEGWVETPQGFVRAYSTSYEGSYESTNLTIIKNGKSHTRYINKFYRARYLVTLAKRFAIEVYNEGQK